ncbi:hypothetical protein GW17_00058803 [Ensete ventricosum]|nr:hypothetical protein GW17_00058803 [Ensete ventricosum]
MRYVLVHLLIGMLTARYRAGPPIWAVSAPLPLEIDYSQFRPLPIAVGRFAISGDKALYRVVRIGLPTDRYADRPLLTLRFLRSFLHNVCSLILLPRLVVTSK